MKSRRLEFLVIGLMVASVQSAYPDYGGEFLDAPAIDSYQVQLQSESSFPLDYDYALETSNATEEVTMTTLIPDYIKMNRSSKEEPITNILYDDDDDDDDESDDGISSAENSQESQLPKGRSFDFNKKSVEVDSFMGAMPTIAAAAAAAAAPTTTQSYYHLQMLPAKEATKSSAFLPTSTIPPLQPSVVAPSSSSSSSPSSSSSSSSSSSAPSTTARSKQGKKIQIKKLLPHEQLRNYIEDAYIRMPLAVIVDPSPAALDKTKSLWGDALRSNMAIKIVLVSLNSSGMPIAYNFNNTKQFLAGLKSVKKSPAGNPFTGIIQACELIPYDSAVFISTAHIPIDADFGQEAAVTLLKKRIRLYLIWYGEKLLSENETHGSSGGILGELAIKSGGDILHIKSNESALESNTLSLIADAYRGTETIDLPVDTTVSNLHIKVDSVMKTATLETPNGEINLRKLESFKSLSPRSLVQSLDTFVPIHNLQHPTTFRLRLTPEYPQTTYKVFVGATTKVSSSEQMERRFNRIITHADLKFPEETPLPRDVEVFPPIQMNATSLSRQLEKGIIERKTLRIQITKDTRLLLAPGEQSNLQYDVENLSNTIVGVDIEVKGERKFLQYLSIQRFRLEPRGKQRVVVRIEVPENTPQGSNDRITFSAQVRSTGEISSLVALAKVVTAEDAADRKEPYLTWTFGSRCDSSFMRASSCSDNYWNLDVFAQDWGSGLLGLYALPASGLTVNENFIAGSNEPLRATFVASCCEPKVSLTVYDLSGNQRTNTINVNDLVLSEGSIAAIVLGSILLILLIILTIVGIVYCCKRRDSTVINLPRYTSSHRRASRADDI